MKVKIQLSGRYRVLNEAQLTKRASRTDDPRHVFYVAMLSNDNYEAYEEAVGGINVSPKTYRAGTVNARMEILYVRKLGWITDDKSPVYLSSNKVNFHNGDMSATRDEANLNENKFGGDVMLKITIPAAVVRQGDLILYSTSVKVKNLISKNFYSVETLDPEKPDDTGYQRLLNTARAKKLADYIVKGQDRQDAFLPTSVLLATDKSIPFDDLNNTITIDVATVGPFSVVDGQHRLEGLKMAALKDLRVLEFDVPVNIAVNLPKIAQMCHFLIVNTTQKSVDKSVEQRIIARLTEALNIEDLPSLPKWILNIVERGDVDKALKMVSYLNEAPHSPWKGKILMANETGDATSINQKSFVTAIVKYLMTANNPLSILNDFDKEKKIFLNYWKAISSLLDDENAAVLYKYNGVELFCKFSIPFFAKLQENGKFTVPVMTQILSSCFEHVEGDYAGVGHSEWWAKGSTASFLNAGAINVVAQEMSKALHRVAMTAEIEI